ncbi:DNA primase, partial [Streptomyces sp. SID2563]|nr:DNA primase [Streptomyces sp. SID2563]
MGFTIGIREMRTGARRHARAAAT